MSRTEHDTAAESIEQIDADGAPEDLAEPNDLGDAGGADETPAGRGVAGWAQWGVLLAALALLGVSIWQFTTADGGEAEDLAPARDAALSQGIRSIETLQTMDHSNIDKHLDQWRSVTTGVLHDQLTDLDDEETQALAERNVKATGKVRDAALTALKAHTATVIAAIEVTVEDTTDPDAEPSVKRNRYAADLVHRDGQWKVENLVQVAVQP